MPLAPPISKPVFDLKIGDAFKMLAIVGNEGRSVLQSNAGDLQIQIGYDIAGTLKHCLQRTESSGRAIVERQHGDSRQQRIYRSQILGSAHGSPCAMRQFGDGDGSDSQLFIRGDSALHIKAAPQDRHAMIRVQNSHKGT